MPATKQVPNATVSTTREVKLEPQLRRKLLTKLRTYQGYRKQLKALESIMDGIKAEIGALRTETGEQSISLEGFTSTLVAPVRKKFNPKTFVKLGGDIDIYNQANEETLSTPYEKVTCPSDE
jgi:hypothetical protein